MTSFPRPLSTPRYASDRCPGFAALLLSAALFAIPGFTNAGDWYVDVDVTGTSKNSGTNWVNAWTNWSSIIWNSLRAGDTVWVSGGIYKSDLRVQKSGTSNNPIVIKASQAVGHNDPIIMTNATIGAYGYNWIIFDGSKSDAVWPKLISTLDVKTVVRTNCNWKANGAFFGTVGGGNNVTLRGIELGNHNTNGYRWQYGIYLNNGSQSNFVVEYCSFYWINDTGIKNVGNLSGRWDSVVVRWCYFCGTGNDWIEGSPGGTYHNNYFNWQNRWYRPALGEGSHADGLAGPMGKTRFYNNIMVDVWDQCVYLKIWEPGTGHGGVQIVGNLIYIDRGATPLKDDGVQTASSFGWETGRSGIPASTHWGDFVFANNTIIADGTKDAGKIRNMIDFVNGYSAVNTIYITNSVIKNNIFYDSPTSGSNLKGPETGFAYGENDLAYDYNVVWSSCAGGKGIVYRGTSYSTAEALNAATRFDHNSSSQPLFRNASAHDYQPASNDTVARNTGANLSSLLPYWSTDLAGHSRLADGLPDRGALEAGQWSGGSSSETEGLLVWLTFEDSFADGKLDDASGNARHAWRYGRPNSPTNWPAQVAAASSPGRTNATGYAGEFRWYQDGWGYYGKSGDYAGITTNLNALTNMSRATIALWARYYSATRISPSFDYSEDQNASLLSTGTASGTPGTWKLGRWYSGETYFTVLTSGNFTYDRSLKFPDAAYSSKGDTLKWNHYAVTFDSGRVAAYFNGRLLTNVTMTVTALKLGRFPHAPFWLGIGTDTHAGTPPLEDESGEDYPNHGWFNGVMDDVRIYGRVLSASEIASIYSGTPVQSVVLQVPIGFGIREIVP